MAGVIPSIAMIDVIDLLHADPDETLKTVLLHHQQTLLTWLA